MTLFTAITATIFVSGVSSFSSSAGETKPFFAFSSVVFHPYCLRMVSHEASASCSIFDMMIFPGVVKRREENTAAIDSVAPEVKKSCSLLIPKRAAHFVLSSSSFLLWIKP